MLVTGKRAASARISHGPLKMQRNQKLDLLSSKSHALLAMAPEMLEIAAQQNAQLKRRAICTSCACRTPPLDV